MFEENLVESRLTHASATQRWTMFGSITLQSAIVVTLIALPLLHPERLVSHVETPLVFTPPPPRPPQPIVHQQAVSSAPSATPSIPVTMRPLIHTLLPSANPTTDTPPIIASGTVPFSAMGNGLPDALGTSTDSGTGVNVAPARPTASRVRVSEGVSAGLLLAPIRPIYPAIAKAARVSGTVVVEAIISKTGIIESLHVVSGPEMLRRAAIDAISAARYQPYRLNGEPTEVQTTITVNFTLGG